MSGYRTLLHVHRSTGLFTGCAGSLKSRAHRLLRPNGGRTVDARHRFAVQASTVTIPKTDLLKVAKTAAEAGAEVVMDFADKPKEINYKGLTDLITATDEKSEASILKVLRQEFPDHAILGEEGGVSGNTSSDYLWCVDPLDGTTNFAHRYPSFGVSVAVLRHAIVLASCVIEFTGGPGQWDTRTFTAYRNGGAQANGVPIEISRVKELEKSLLITGFGYEHDDAWSTNMAFFKHFTDVTQGVRRLGAASVDLCHVALGRTSHLTSGRYRADCTQLGIAEAYWEYRLKPWDTAGGVLVVEEAGGMVTTMDGLAYSPFDRSVIASNGFIHKDLLKTIEPATAKLLDEGFDLSPWCVPEGYRIHLGAQLDT